MMNQDNLFEQIQKAERSAEDKEFPGLDAVWSRVEGKLDNKVLVKQNRKWKQWAAAASIIAVGLVGYEFFRPDTEPQPTEVKTADRETPTPAVNEAIATVETDTTILRKDAATTLERRLSRPVVVARNSEAEIKPSASAAAADAPMYYEATSDSTQAKTASVWLNDDSNTHGKSVKINGRVFDARVVHSDETVAYEDVRKSTAAKSVARKSKPLLVVDGKPLVAKSDKEYDKKLGDIMETIPAERDTVFYLKEPLYIINGVEYSEESLFGPNPTSPYAPLNLQEKGMTTDIFTGKEAIKKFGEKGKNGVVVISTKNGRPGRK